MTGLFVIQKKLPTFISYMRIDILSILPELLKSPLQHSILKRAQEKGIVEIFTHNIRDYSTNKHKKVDDYSFGIGAGMVMTIQPIADLINKLRSMILIFINSYNNNDYLYKYCLDYFIEKWRKEPK